MVWQCELSPGLQNSGLSLLIYRELHPHCQEICKWIISSADSWSDFLKSIITYPLSRACTRARAHTQTLFKSPAGVNLASLPTWEATTCKRSQDDFPSPYDIFSIVSDFNYANEKKAGWHKWHIARNLTSGTNISNAISITAEQNYNQEREPETTVGTGLTKLDSCKLGKTLPGLISISVRDTGDRVRI